MAKMGRPQLLDISKEDFIFLYRKHKTYKVMAKILQLSERSIRNYGKRFGFASKRGRPFFSRNCKDWLATHPDVKLPHSLRKAAKLMNLPYQIVQRYFKKSIVKLEEIAIKMKTSTTGNYKTIDGWSLPRGMFKITDMTINKKALVLRITGITQNGKQVKFLFKP